MIGEYRPQRARSWRWTLSAAVIGLVIMLRQGHLLTPPKPVIMPPQIITSGSTRPMRGSESSLLGMRSRLHLSASQQNQLQKLSDAESAATRPLNDRIRQDQTQFNRFMQSATTHGGATLHAIQAEGEPLVADSKMLANLQQEYWSKALLELTPSQKTEAERLLAAGHPSATGRGFDR